MFNSTLLGAGLAMDAFSVTVTDGMREPAMSRRRMLLIAGTYAFFQCVMPLAGWIFVRALSEQFEAFRKYIPWIALVLLSYIGGKMLAEGIRGLSKNEDEEPGEADRAEAPESSLTGAVLIMQAVATSIDALSVGFTIANYGWAKALGCGLIIAAVTLLICAFGIRIGRRIGTALNSRATMLGGIILIIIGLEIFVKDLL